MGRTVDRLFLYALCAFFSFAFFIRSRISPVLSALFALLFTLCLIRLLRRPASLLQKRKESRSRARRMVISWPYRPIEKSRGEAACVLSHAHIISPEDTSFVFLPHHPVKTLSPEDILSHRRTHDGPLILAAACPASPAARAAAASCDPPVALFDRRDMIRLARRWKDIPEISFIPSPRERISYGFSRLRPARCAAWGCISLLWFILTGSRASLFSGAALLILWALARLRHISP